jgi:hypothetical protein
MLPYLIGCPEPLAQQALVDSAIDFCSRTNAVSVNLDPITVIRNIATYEVETPPQTRVSAVQRVWYDNKALLPAPYEQATDIYNQPNGSPRFFFGEYVDEIYSITLVPTPDKNLRNGLRIRTSLIPVRSATQVHDILFDRYAEGIVHGAIAIVAAIPDQSYSDLTLAAASAVRARAETALARGEALHGNVQSSMSVKMRAF